MPSNPQYVDRLSDPKKIETEYESIKIVELVRMLVLSLLISAALLVSSLVYYDSIGWRLLELGEAANGALSLLIMILIVRDDFLFLPFWTTVLFSLLIYTSISFCIVVIINQMYRYWSRGRGGES